MASIEQVKALLGAAMQKAGEGAVHHLAGEENVGEALELTHSASEGTSHPKIEEALMHYQAANQKSAEANSSINAAGQAIQEYMASI